jgi:hypothetical protein
VLQLSPLRGLSVIATGRKRGLWWSLGALALLGFAGCHADTAKDKAPADKAADKTADKKGESPGENKPVLDQKIASAMAAAEKQAEIQAQGGRGEGSPPADGMLGAEAAAREVPPGSPALVVLGAEGSSPRLRLGPEHLSAGAAAAGVLQISYRSGGSVMPTLDLDWKAKTSAGAEALKVASLAPAGAAGAGGGLGFEPVVTRFGVVNARPSAKQPGRLPDEARAEIAKLKGSWIDVVSTPRGAVQSQRLQVTGNNRDLEPFVQSGAEALASVTIAYPEVPVGVGGYWMVKSREQAEGSDVIAYRMVKVTELGHDSARLTVSTRRYLVGSSLALEGLPPHRVRQFESEGTATLNVHPGAAYPSSADIQDRVMALVAPDDRPSQPPLPVQSELTAKFTLSP